MACSRCNLGLCVTLVVTNQKTLNEIKNIDSLWNTNLSSIYEIYTNKYVSKK